MSQLNISSSPHIRPGNSTRRIMLDVIIALAPAAICSIFIFGSRSLLVMGLSVLTAVACEALCLKVMKRRNTVNDLSAVVTGLLYALVLPVGAPVYVVILGSAFAIIIAKQCFGGLGANILNPALAGRAFMFLSFAGVFSSIQYNQPLADAVTGATPLDIGYQPGEMSLWELILGNYGGALGETCKWAILLGLLYLLLRRVISWRIPAVMLAAAALTSLILGRECGVAADLLSGGLLFGAVFMATDYATSPITPLGQIIYAAGCGVLTILIRQFAAWPEGTMFAILLMNLVTPLIDKYIKPRVFGEVKSK